MNMLKNQPTPHTQRTKWWKWGVSYPAVTCREVGSGYSAAVVFSSLTQQIGSSCVNLSQIHLSSSQGLRFCSELTSWWRPQVLVLSVEMYTSMKPCWFCILIYMLMSQRTPCVLHQNWSWLTLLWFSFCGTDTSCFTLRVTNTSFGVHVFLWHQAALCSLQHQAFYFLNKNIVYYYTPHIKYYKNTVFIFPPLLFSLSSRLYQSLASSRYL